MSLHFEVVFSLFLSESTPETVIAELRWQLGLARSKPATARFPDETVPLLEPAATSYLPGGETCSLERQYRFTQAGVDRHAWGLFVRTYWLDDKWAEYWWQVAEWLSARADDDGYAGFYREVDEKEPTLFLVFDRRPWVQLPGEPAQPFGRAARSNSPEGGAIVFPSRNDEGKRDD